MASASASTLEHEDKQYAAFEPQHKAGSVFPQMKVILSTCTQEYHLMRMHMILPYDNGVATQTIPMQVKYDSVIQFDDHDRSFYV